MLAGVTRDERTRAFIGAGEAVIFKGGPVHAMDNLQDLTPRAIIEKRCIARTYFAKQKKMASLKREAMKNAPERERSEMSIDQFMQA